jgi:hypothetical protein
MQKSSEKFQHPFMINALTKLGIEGINMIKAIYNKSIANSILNWEKTNDFLYS